MPWWLIRLYVEGLQDEFNPPDDEDDFYSPDAHETGDVEVVDDLSTLGVTTTQIQ